MIVYLSVKETLLQMRTLRSRLALVLLLCFVRVALPDVWVLALHQHEHTTEEVTPAQRKQKALLTARHQHCQTDHFYNVPFQPVPPLEFAALVGQPLRTATPHVVAGWPRNLTLTCYLRGPPARA